MGLHKLKLSQLYLNKTQKIMQEPELFLSKKKYDVCNN